MSMRGRVPGRTKVFIALVLGVLTATARAAAPTISIQGAPALGSSEGFSTCTFNLTNTDAAAAVPAGTHPQDAAAYLGSDVYRLSASATGTGWGAYLKNALTTAKLGESVSVPVYIEKGTGSGSVTLKAVSESDPTKTASAVCTLGDGNVGGSVPATLALTMGAPADFGPFTPGLGKDYFATTAANVISTAGDATLAVADPSSTATGHLVNGAFSLASPLQANGLPFTFSRFNGQGKVTVPSLLQTGDLVPVDTAVAAGPHRKQMPLGNEVIAFPGAPGG